MSLDVRKRAEAVHLWLEDEIRVIERLGDSEQPHRALDAHRDTPS
jgi:hypothetical protein